VEIIPTCQMHQPTQYPCFLYYENQVGPNKGRRSSYKRA
jgi:hypothetical protein